jgi:O-antigen/teichoic acid export membrane protein
VSDLGRWQTISFASRMISKVIGMVPSILIPRILSVSDFGVVGIAKSLGKTFGVTQNLGLASGSTREISNHLNTKEDIFKIFVTSVFIKYLLSFPMALALFLMADYLSVKYDNPALVIPLKIYSIVLVIQNVQSLFNSVVQGMQRFKLLFTYQVAITIPNVLLFVTLVYLYGVNGYFYASLAFNTLASIVLGVLALWPLRHSFVMPSREDFKRIGKAVFVVSLAVYAAKIIYTFWEGIGPLILGQTINSGEIGYFVFAALYAGQLMAISDSITDVNLSVFSKQYSMDSTQFKEVFMANFNKIYVLVLFIASSAIYWSYEITTLFYAEKYLPSLILIPPILSAFVFYSYINIAKSSIFVPAKLMRELVFSYLLILIGTVGFYIVLKQAFDPLMAMGIGMALGTVLSYISMNFFTMKKINLLLFNAKHVVLLLLAVLLALASGFSSSKVIEAFTTWYLLFPKFVLYLAFVALFYFLSAKVGFFDLTKLSLWKKIRNL